MDTPQELLDSMKRSEAFARKRLDRLQAIKALLSDDALELSQYEERTLSDERLVTNSANFSMKFLGKIGQEIALVEHYCSAVAATSTRLTKDIESGMFDDVSFDDIEFGSGLYQ